VETYDQPAIRSILSHAEAGRYRFSDIVQGIVASMPFQMKMKAGDIHPEQQAHLLQDREGLSQ
jgi:hypothetical protein